MELGHNSGVTQSGRCATDGVRGTCEEAVRPCGPYHPGVRHDRKKHAVRAALAAGVLAAASLGAVAVAGSASAAQSPDGPKTRIVGGTIAHTADTPWAIQLSNSGSPDPTGEYCGSTLVAANKIVTAAHCSTEDASAPTPLFRAATT